MLSNLRRLLRLGAFRRLLGVRLLVQGADGVFQAILTAYLFFSPRAAGNAGGDRGGDRGDAAALQRGGPVRGRAARPVVAPCDSPATMAAAALALVALAVSAARVLPRNPVGAPTS